MKHSPAPDRVNALGTIQREIKEIPLAPAVRVKVRNHYEDLAKLASTLQKLGIDEYEIDHHVMEIFGDYRTHLIRSVEHLTRDQPRNSIR